MIKLKDAGCICMTDVETLDDLKKINPSQHFGNV